MKTRYVITVMLVCLASIEFVELWTATGISLSFCSRQVSSVSIPLRANFTYSPLDPVVNQQVHFYDHSSPSDEIVLWTWDFNGTMVNATNYDYKFTSGGWATVSLTVVNASQYATQVSVFIFVQKVNTTLSLDVPRSTGNGDEVTLTATLTDEYGNQAPSDLLISFYVNDSRGNNILIDAGVTDSLGRASVIYTPASSGVAEAVFNGNAVYSGAVSNEQTITIGFNILPYAVLASVAVIVMSIALAYLRTRSRRSSERERDPSEKAEETE